MHTIFPDSVQPRQWTEFPAEGFSTFASGVVFDGGQPTTGVPLGGIGTGWVDLNGTGLLGRTSIFNSFAPPRVLNLPFLGVAVGGRSHCLSTTDVPGVEKCSRVRYWGHYPVADFEFKFDAPLTIGLRAWAPFFPGDAVNSNSPVAVFEVRIRNASESKQAVRVVLTFPGPSAEESGTSTFSHEVLRTADLAGACVRWSGGNYVLACSPQGTVETGGFVEEWRWAKIAERLPSISGSDPGCSVCDEFVLDAQGAREIPFVLAWHVPRWRGSAAHSYRHAYADRFADAPATAAACMTHRREWLLRILAWQQEIYFETDLPVWLRDQLVNVLHTITRDSFWASHSIPRQAWYGDDGLFGLTESPRTTPHVCNPSDWYGSLPVIFFFPKLMASLLRAYAHFQLPSGEIPLGIGDKADFACQPVYQIMHPMNSCVHIHLIDRLWQRDPDSGVLREFYPSALRALRYMRELVVDQDDGLPEFDADPIPNQFYGDWPWYGLPIHVAGFWLAALSMMRRMAEACGDSETEVLCRDWSHRASCAVERNLWGRSSYLLYRESKTGRMSDTVLANQLVGQWCARLHSLPGVCPQDHVREALESVLETCGRITDAGLLNATKRDGTLDIAGGRQSAGIFTGECLAAAATMVYEMRQAEGTEMARRMMDAIVMGCGAGWDLPNILDAGGKIIHGDDFYQMMILWALPLALKGTGIREACAPGSLISRIISCCGASE